MSFKRVLFRQVVQQRSVRVRDGSIASRLTLRPFKYFAFYRTRDCECEMRLSRLKFVGGQILQQEAEGLLRDVFRRQRRLLPCDTANSAMQHGEKCENEKALDETGIERADREEFAQQRI